MNFKICIVSSFALFIVVLLNVLLFTGHLCLKGDQKMSKSLKNTISIQDFLEKYTENHMRLICLLSHYRTGTETFYVCILVPNAKGKSLMCLCKRNMVLSQEMIK